MVYDPKDIRDYFPERSSHNPAKDSDFLTMTSLDSCNIIRKNDNSSGVGYRRISIALYLGG